MIDHCDSSFLANRFARERLPLSHQLPAPSSPPLLSEARAAIALRDKAWMEAKVFALPSAAAVHALRCANASVIVKLLICQSPFPSDLTHVEALLCQVCDIYLLWCDAQRLAQERTSGVALTREFLRRSFQMALAPEEELPPGAL